MKRTLKLADLKVDSFVTQLSGNQQNTAQGGNKYGSLRCEGTLTATSGYENEHSINGCD